MLPAWSDSHGMLCQRLRGATLARQGNFHYVSPAPCPDEKFFTLSTLFEILDKNRILTVGTHTRLMKCAGAGGFTSYTATGAANGKCPVGEYSEDYADDKDLLYGLKVSAAFHGRRVKSKLD